MAKASGKTYRGPAYWEQETPVVVDTARVRLSYYADHGKLQVSLLFPDRETGEPRRGKTVTWDQEDMQLHPAALALVEQVVADWAL